MGRQLEAGFWGRNLKVHGDGEGLWDRLEQLGDGRDGTLVTGEQEARRLRVECVAAPGTGDGGLGAGVRRLGPRRCRPITMHHHVELDLTPGNVDLPGRERADRRAAATGEQELVAVPL